MIVLYNILYKLFHWNGVKRHQILFLVLFFLLYNFIIYALDIKNNYTLLTLITGCCPIYYNYTSNVLKNNIQRFFTIKEIDYTEYYLICEYYSINHKYIITYKYFVHLIISIFISIFYNFYIYLFYTLGSMFYDYFYYGCKDLIEMFFDFLGLIVYLVINYLTKL